jgi:tight adherence protein C
MILFLGVALVFVALFVVFAAIGGLQSETRGVNRSLAVLEAMTSAPTEMTKELDKTFGERVLEPLYERANRLGRRMTGADAADRIRHKLDLAGNPPGWTVDRFSAGKIVGGVAGLGFSLLFAQILSVSATVLIVVVAAGAAIGFLAPNFYLYQLAYNRSQLMQREMADAIDLLTISVESGLGFDAALQQVARNTEGPLAGEFQRALQEMQLGMGRSEALRAMGERNTMPELRSFTSAMVQADAFGIPIGQVLRVQSSEIRVKRRQRAEEMAQKVPVKITVPLIFCILPTLFIAVLGPAAIQIMDNITGR